MAAEGNRRKLRAQPQLLVRHGHGPVEGSALPPDVRRRGTDVFHSPGVAVVTSWHRLDCCDAIARLTWRTRYATACFVRRKVGEINQPIEFIFGQPRQDDSAAKE